MQVLPLNLDEKKKTHKTWVKSWEKIDLHTYNKLFNSFFHIL